MASKRDRDRLRSRIKALLDAEGRSQKDLEAALGLSAGMLTRLFSGKKLLDAELLATLAEGLDTEAAALVHGTGWESLLGGAAPGAATASETDRVERPGRVEGLDEPTAEVNSEPEPAAVNAERPPEPEPALEPPRPQPATPEAARAEPRGSSPRIEPPHAGHAPPPPRRRRKRDLPALALRFIAELIFG